MTDALPLPPLARLHQWAEQGWLRRLDSAFAAFVLQLDPAASPALLWSSALLAQLEGRGHTCLPLADLLLQPLVLVAWPAEGAEALQAFLPELPNRLDDWLQALQTSPVVRTANSAVPDQGQPLVLDGTAHAPRLYLRRYWLHEQQVAQHVRQRAQAHVPVNETEARQWLNQLFDPPIAPGTTDAIAVSDDEPDWQKLACAVALRAELTLITGGPGTGKTYTAARLLALLFALHGNQRPLRVALAAPTGKAAARLRQSIDSSLAELGHRMAGALDLPALIQRMGAAQTLHALLGARRGTRAFRQDANHPLDVDILIVDEASMIHLEMMSALLQALPKGARVIFLGDKDQLASVEAGAVLGDLCATAATGAYSPETVRYAQALTGQSIPARYQTQPAWATPLSQQTVMLRKSRRFGGHIGQLAMAINSGNYARCTALFSDDATGALCAMQPADTQAVLQLCVRGRSGASACYADYLSTLHARADDAKTDVALHAAWVKAVLRAFDRFRVLCAVHAGDWGSKSLNQGIQTALAQAGWLQVRGEWYSGRPVMVTRNDPELGVLNGDIGIALPGVRGSSGLRVYFLEGEAIRSVGVSRLSHVETAFAMTVHKSQGSEFVHTALVLPPGGKLLTRELAYTGVTRARQAFTLIEGQAGVFQQAIRHTAERHSGLALQLAAPTPCV